MAERVFESSDAPALSPDRHEIVVYVEAEVLSNGGAGRCEIEHRTSIAAETARRLCCDAGIVPVVDGPNGEPLSVGRRTRSIPPAVRRALANRDRGCRFPGCPGTQRLHGHHVRNWAEGGETSLDNLVLLCPTHHRLVHEGGFDVKRLDDGGFRFTNPYGVTIRPPRRRETSSSDTIVVRNESLGLAIDCETATAHWHGERIDYDHALMVGMASWDSGGHTAGGGTGGWGLESVVGEGCRACGVPISCCVRARSGTWTFEWRFVTASPEVRPLTGRTMRPHLEGAGELARRTVTAFRRMA